MADGGLPPLRKGASSVNPYAKVRNPKNGLVGRMAKDMRLSNPWGPLEAVEQGGLGHWHFRCYARGHMTILSAQSVRAAFKDGKPRQCPLCKKEDEEKAR